MGKIIACKHEDRSLNPHNPHKKSGMAVCARHLSIGGSSQEDVGSSHLLRKALGQANKADRTRGRYQKCLFCLTQMSDVHTHTQAHRQAPMHVHTLM